MSIVTLYHYEDTYVDIKINAYFMNESLVIDGYDVGKMVEDEWSDPDFQDMFTTVGQNELKKLYPLLNVPFGDKDGLMKAIAEKYNTNNCYNEFIDFLTKNNIASGGRSKVFDE